MKIFNSIYTVLKSRLNEVSGIRRIDWFNDQYKNTEDEKATRYPAIYIEMLDPVEWKQSGRKFQTGRLSIRLHCVVYDIKDSPDRTIDFCQKVFEHINSKGLYDNTDFQLTTELVRSTTTFPKRYNQLKVVLMDFDCECFDVSNMPVGTAVSPEFIISASS